MKRAVRRLVRLRGRLAAADRLGDVEPVNTALVPNYATYNVPQGQAWNT